MDTVESRIQPTDRKQTEKNWAYIRANEQKQRDKNETIKCKNKMRSL